MSSRTAYQPRELDYPSIAITNNGQDYFLYDAKKNCIVWIEGRKKIKMRLWLLPEIKIIALGFDDSKNILVMKGVKNTTHYEHISTICLE